VTWKIALTPAARQMFEAIRDRRVRRSLAERIDGLANEPEKQGKPLIGELAGLRSLRAVGQRYRILYRMEKEVVLVLVVAIGLRKDGSKKDIYSLARKLLRLRLLEPEDESDEA
jgi:mRNA interferase RelE/StbE